MFQRDPHTVDLGHQKLRIADDVMVWPVHERGERVYRMEIPSLHRFFRVGYEEYVLISLLDGNTTLPQACGLAAAKLGKRAPTETQAHRIVRWLLSNDLAHFASDPPPQRSPGDRQPQGGSHPKGSPQTLLQQFNPFWMKLPLPSSDRWMPRVASGLEWLLGKRSLAVGIFLLLIAAFVLASHWTEFKNSSSDIIATSNGGWLLLSWLGLKVIHELAHAAACQRVGGSVHQSGIVLILLAPLAYVDVSSCWRLDSRWLRIAVSAAGMYVELLIAAIAVLAWATVDSMQARFLLQNLIFAAGFSTLLFNANVLMRFDGYFILADLIEVPNLHAEGSAALRCTASRWITGQPSMPGNLLGWRKVAVLFYGIASLAWRVTVCVSLAILASTLMAGGGIALAALGIGIWLGQPLMAGYRFATDLRITDPRGFWRSVMVTTLMIALVSTGFFFVPIPTSVTAPAIVQYPPETAVRSRVSGFIKKLHVQNGTVVHQGDLLVEIENPEITHRVKQLELSLAQDQIRLHRATDQHDASEQQILRETINALSQQLTQLRTRQQGLRLVAPRSGTVIARSLRSRLGDYVHEGDPVLVVASDTHKKIIAIIDQRSVKEVRSMTGQPIPIRTAGFQHAVGHLERVEPLGSVRLKHQALAASEGGTLAVQMTRNSEQEEALLVEPHFIARIDLAPHVAARLPAGIRVEASFGHESQPLANRMQQAIRKLWITAHR